MADDVAVGMVFERHGAPHLRCVVEALTRVDGIPHVFIRSLGDQTDVRLLAASVLADRNTYRPVDLDPG